MRRLLTALVGIAFALTVAGVAVSLLEAPSFTAQLAARVSNAEAAGLTPGQMLQVAEQVRAFVTDRDADPLPETVEGRPGFDDEAVSHLVDVRAVVSGAQLLTGLLAAVLTVWLGFELVRGRLDRMAAALRAGGWACLALVGVGVLAGLASFDALFAWFHSLFFAAGTWTFPADSLLILVFPERFWIAAGLAWGLLVAAGGGLLLLAARWLDVSAANRAAAKDSETGE